MPNTFVYPASDFDKTRNLLSVLGGFWFETYHGQKELQDIVVARQATEQQVQTDLLEAIAAVSRANVPILHRENWQLLTLKQSDLNITNVHRYGDGDVYGAEPQSNQYGGFGQGYYAFPLPERLADLGVITNRVTQPSLLLTDGVDFVLDRDRGVIVFKENPFENSLIPTRPVYTNGEQSDVEGFLWGFKAGFDNSIIHDHFGYVLGVRLYSSSAYRDLVNAVFDSIVLGSTVERVEKALAAMTGIPLVVEQTETVQLATADSRGAIVVTDQHAYRFTKNVTLTVAAGDVVHAGQTLIDEFRVSELNRGEVPQGLRAITLGRGLLSWGFYGELMFSDEEVDLIVNDDHISGRTYVSFALHGHPLDVQKFFDDVHERGIERGKTLAELLDTREDPDPAVQPTAENLPTKINPLTFLTENVLRNVVVARITSSAFMDGAGGLNYARLLRKIVPPRTALLLIVEISKQRDEIPAPTDGTITSFTGAEPLSDQPSPPEDRISYLRPVGLRCE